MKKENILRAFCPDDGCLILNILSSWNSQYENYNLGPEYCRFYTEKEVYGEKVRQIYFLLVLTLVYIIPFILTISAYTTILHTLFRQFYKELQFRY